MSGFSEKLMGFFGMAENPTLKALHDKLEAAELSGDYLHSRHMGREFSVEIDEETDTLLISAACNTAVKVFMGTDLEKSGGFYTEPFQLEKPELAALKCMCVSPHRINQVLDNNQCVGELARLFAVGQAHLLTEPVDGYMQMDWNNVDMNDLTADVLLEVVGAVCYVAACLEDI